VREAQRYRASIDSHIRQFTFRREEKLLDVIEPILVLGIHHEQQHQELLVTDIKHVFAQNPLYPFFAKQGASLRARRRNVRQQSAVPTISSISKRRWSPIGHDGSGFAYDTKDRNISRWFPHFRCFTADNKR